MIALLIFKTQISLLVQILQKVKRYYVTCGQKFSEVCKQCDKLLLFSSYISTPKGQQTTQKITLKSIKYFSFGKGKIEDFF